MCVDPVVALTIGSTLLGGASAIGQGQAQASAARYQSKVAEMNAVLSDRRARDALEQGKLEEQRQMAKNAQLLGRQRAATGANGVDMSFGSPLDNIVDTAVLGQLDAMTIRRNAANEAFDFEQAGLNYRADARMQRSAAKSALAGGYLSAAGTVLTGGAKAYGSWQAQRIDEQAAVRSRILSSGASGLF